MNILPLPAELELNREPEILTPLCCLIKKHFYRQNQIKDVKPQELTAVSIVPIH